MDHEKLENNHLNLINVLYAPSLIWSLLYKNLNLALMYFTIILQIKSTNSNFIKSLNDVF